MAVYTIELSSGPGAITSIDALYIRKQDNKDWVFDSLEDANLGYSKAVALFNIIIPTNSSPVKVFSGYYDESCNLRISNSGHIYLHNYNSTSGDVPPYVSSDGTWTAVWNNICPVAQISNNGGTGGTSEIYFNSEDSKWYLDYPFETELSSSNPITPPTRACYRFIGLYSKSTNGTKYFNADGTPTAAFLSLSPTTEITIYAQWEQVSYKVTVGHRSGSPTSTVFYAKVGATGTGRFFSDDQCTRQISSITPPMRELYRWNGAFSSSTQSQANTYIDSSGAFQPLLYNLSITSNKTISYANYWTQISYVITQYASSGWTYEQAKYYTDKTNGGIYSDWLCESTALDHLPIPSKSGYRYIGSYSTIATSGTKYVEGSGLISSSLNTNKATTTIYPQGRAASFVLTLNPNGGTGGGAIYYDATSGDAAFFGPSSAVITSVTPPVYTGNAFLGYFTEQTGGTQVIDASGNILGSWTPTSDSTVFAQWGIDVSIIEVDAGEATESGTTRFWYRGSTGKFYSDSDLTHQITSVSMPTRRLFNTSGLYSEENVQVVNASGVILPGFTPSQEFVYIHATYTRRCYEMILSTGGGTSLVSAVYRSPGGTTWYTSESLTTSISNVGVSVRTGYTFAGYTYGGSTVISSTGSINASARIDEDYTATAVWNVHHFTITFDGNGAAPSFASKSVTYGSAIGNLPTVSLSGRRFESWQVDGSDIKSTDIWLIDSNKTAVARWKDNFGGLTDWFNLSNGLLMIVGSESGENRKVTNLWNGAYEQGNQLKNPVCTYRVKASGNVTIRLGKAFKNGFFITEFSYKTGADMEPVLVVSGTANEGADAINLYDVSLHVDPDHVSQDPFNAVTGGGELVEMTSTATCDAVVAYENNRPCASDVVHARLTVTGRKSAYFDENPPTFINSFIDSGVQKSESDVDFTTYVFTAEKGIV